MRLLSVLPLVLAVSAAVARSNVHRAAALTEQLGQEVIQVSGAIRDLPQGVDEEPAAENDLVMEVRDAARQATTEGKPVFVMNRTRRYREDPEEEEARIQKELAEVYKDVADYDPRTKLPAVSTTKADSDDTRPPASVSDATDPGPTSASSNSTEDAATEAIDQPDDDVKALRSNDDHDQFQFQPHDVRDLAEVARFRTSVDDVSCDIRQRGGGGGSCGSSPAWVNTEIPKTANASAIFVNIFLVLSALLAAVLR